MPESLVLNQIWIAQVTGNPGDSENRFVQRGLQCSTFPPAPQEIRPTNVLIQRGEQILSRGRRRIIRVQRRGFQWYFFLPSLGQGARMQRVWAQVRRDAERCICRKCLAHTGHTWLHPPRDEKKRVHGTLRFAVLISSNKIISRAKTPRKGARCFLLLPYVFPPTMDTPVMLLDGFTIPPSPLSLTPIYRPPPPPWVTRHLDALLLKPVTNG